MKKTILTTSLFLVMVTSFLSCDKTQIFDEYATIKNGWKKNEFIKFVFSPSDTLSKNNLFLNLRTNNDYPFQNLFLIVKVKQPKGKINIDTLEYAMAKPDGTLLGEGFSDIKESKLWFKENYIFAEKGKHTIIIEQAVRETGKIKGLEKLYGITEVGFRIEKSQK